MKLAYVSGPYRAKTIRGVLKNIRIAEEIAIELWKMGYAVICPHSNTRLYDGAFDEGKISYHEDKEKSHWGGGSVQFIKGDLAILDRFDPKKDVIVMVPNWQSSGGATIEHNYAVEINIEAYYWDNEIDQKRLRQNAHDPDDDKEVR
jgi:hypothetical protein